jgi:hypothetical protein
MAMSFTVGFGLLKLTPKRSKISPSKLLWLATAELRSELS